MTEIMPPQDLLIWSQSKTDESQWMTVNSYKLNQEVAQITDIGPGVVLLLQRFYEYIYFFHTYKEGGSKPVCIHMEWTMVHFYRLSQGLC